MNCLEFYEEMHKKHPDALLLFRSGDFYQMFCGDAREGASILGITLAYFRSDPKTATCVFPHHELDTYLPRLIRAGKRVAICDLPEPPKTTKKRGITESLTPKTETTMKLNIKNNNQESANVAAMPAVINNSAATAATERTEKAEYAEYVEVKEESKPAQAKSKSKPKGKKPAKPAKPAKPSASYRLVLIPAKDGGEWPKLYGFTSMEAAQDTAARMANSVRASWDRDDNGEKRFFISAGKRYVDSFKELCEALNSGDQAAVARAIAKSLEAYAGAVSQKKAERDAERAQKKAAADKTKAKQVAKVKKENGLYTAAEMAEFFKRAMAGEDVPELAEVKKLLKAA